MIKINNLNKYFNRNKGNEIHVINDLTLELPMKGLVVLLGPSGSGKTTLLNVLGGLDRTQNGAIDFDGELIQGYKSKTWDHIRNEHIGYVFQNYNLLNDQTVYDNIALSLRMVGITEKEEIDTRVDYLLSNMGMINYRRRKAANLSGGQQQRVAIARALAKNPKVIIADEPTGNLDSKNTFDIMNILRAISQNKLVVLVTHEENIANLYADRIIRLSDGRVVEDIENQSIGGVDVQLETDIYLKDLTQVADLNKGKASYKVYSDEETDANFDVKLIVKNKTLYVQVASDQFTRINLLEKDSEIAVFDEHFKGQEIEEFTETEFDLTKVIDESKRKTGLSVIPFKEAVRLGLNRFKDMGRMKMFQNILFFLNAAIVGIALALLFNAYTVENLDFVNKPVNIITVRTQDNTFDEMDAEIDPDIGYMSLIDKVDMSIKLPKIYQTNGNEMGFSYSPVPIQYLDRSTLIAGRAVEAQNEVVLNEYYVTQLMRNSLFESLGIQTMEDFLNLTLIYTINSNGGNSIDVEVDIVGISDVDDAVFYAELETIWMMAYKIGIYEVYEDDISISQGAVTNTYGKYIIVNNTLATSPLVATPFVLQEMEFELEAIASTNSDKIPTFLMKFETLREAVYNKATVSAGSRIDVYARNPESAVNDLVGKGYEAEYPYTAIRATFMQNKILASIGYIMFAGVFLGAAFIGTFFIMRSSLLSRIYEVSVYRALGAPKKDLRRIFVVETMIMTLFTSVLGYLATSYILVKLQVMTEGYFKVVKVTPLSFVAGLVIILLINLLSGVIPVSNLLRRTPAEIISKYDF